MLHETVPQANRLGVLWNPTTTPSHRPAVRISCLDRERRMLFLPDSKTGRKPVILSGAALAVLEGLHVPASM
jgi:hypothetical protein